MKITNVRCENMPAEYDKKDMEIYCINTDKPHFSFSVEGAGDGVYVSHYKLIVSSTPELAADGVGDMYDTGSVKSRDIHDIEYAGKPLYPRSVYYFRIFASVGGSIVKSRICMFSTGIGDVRRLTDHFISAADGFLQKYPEAEGYGGVPAPYFRRDIRINRQISSVYAYVTSLGVYEMFINGEKVGTSVFDPGFTDYSKTLQYKFYNVTGCFRKGANTVGSVVGDGWYRSNLSSVGRDNFGDRSAFAAYFYFIYDDGSYDELFTDTVWECASGAYICTDNQNGEIYDARLERRGRFFPDHSDYGWAASASCRAPFLYGTKLVPSKGPSVREIETISPVTITKAGDDYVVDMGQNMVGVISLRLRCGAGTRITVKHGEMLNDSNEGTRGCDGPEGTVYTANLRTAKQTDVYICRGEDDLYMPHFTFHGFRYVQISGMPYKPSADDIKGHVLSSFTGRTGIINTSDERLNRLIKNILWGNKGNFFSLPTDCPQRDERLGWTGDAQVFSRSACYASDCAEFFGKYLNDIRDAQKSNGSVTDIAPMIRHRSGQDLVGNGNAAWGDAVFVIPWQTYQMFGDKRIITDNLDAAEKYFKYLEGTANYDLRRAEGYGDWLSVNENTPKDVLATAFYAYDAKLLSLMADAVGDREKSVYYEKRFDEISYAWREAYIEDDDIIRGDTQCCYLLALKFGLVSGETKRNAVKHLQRKISEADGHLQTGFVGVSYLLPVLCDNGCKSTAYDILLRDTYPSWLYSVENGATTIWERWNSYTKENGFGDVGMNSFNHYSLGSCSEWMYEYMLGIKPLSPGYSRFSYRPFPDKRLSHVSGSYNSRSGVIISEWKRTDRGFDLRLTVPVNATAVVAPDKNMHLSGIRGYSDCDRPIELGSGVYSFFMTDVKEELK